MSTVVRRYLQAAPVVDFRLIVSPLVAWIWIGGVIVVGGAMVALWPASRPCAGAWRRPRPRPADPQERAASRDDGGF